jgi:hypothetical protein
MHKKNLDKFILIMPVEKLMLSDDSHMQVTSRL